MKIHVIICLFISSITSNAQEVFVNSQASKNEANFFPNPTAFVAQETITIPDGIQTITKDEKTGLVTVTDTKGVKHDLPQGKDVAVVDENGRGSLVDKQGQITNTTAEQAKAAGKREYGFSVVFEKATESKAGFDKYDGKTTALKNTYQKIEEYIVPWKAIGTGTNVVKGNLNFGTARDLLFEQEGARLTYNEFTNILTVNPVSTGSTAQVIVKEKVGGKEKIRGKLNVAGYASMSKTVHIIPVNNATSTISNADLKTYLDDVYGQALVSWQVDIKNKIEVPFTGDFDDGGSGLLSTYTGDMRKVINAYGRMEQEHYYIFLIDRGKTKTGYMPRGKRAGFVFLNSQNGEELKHTIAHELGHGAFTLRHPFAEYPTVTEKSTDNLMDYAGGTHLYKWQWDQIHNPVLVLGLFEGDSEGEMQQPSKYPYSLDGMVDMSKGSYMKLNELGWPQDKKYFWKTYDDPFKALSEKNLKSIVERKSPVVDEYWIKKMPDQKNAIIGEVIEHHHLNKGRYAIPLAKSLHRSAESFKFNHPKIIASSIYTKSTAIWGRTGKTIVGRLVSFLGLALIVLDVTSEDPHKIPNVLMGYEDGKVLRTQPLSGFKVGRIYAIEEYGAYFGVNDLLIEEGEITAIKYTIYDNYAYDKIEKKYIGVGEIISGAICTSGPFWPIKEY